MAVLSVSGRPTSETKGAYIERVFELLESYDYPDLVMGFEEQQVGMAMAKTIDSCWICSLSERMCAIIIWSFTFNSQIIEPSKKATKH
jgi:hypothetical protein